MASIRKHRSKFQVQIRRQGFPSVTRSFTKLADAKEWARAMETKADRGDLAPSRSTLKQMTLGDLVERYRDEIVPSKRGAEIETIILNAFLRHSICHKLLSAITTADFANYRDHRLQDITPKSLSRQLSPLSNMFEVARNEWQLPIKNPLKNLKLPTTNNRRERRLREGELERLIDAAKGTRNPLLVPLILFALETAMRRGEMLALRWTDIDLPRASATIRESKNGYSRTIPLTSAAIGILEALRSNYELVFPTTAMAVRMSFERLCKRAEIDDLNFHDLRHEAISRLFEKGLTVPEVASISGHRDMRMLFRYAHASHQSIRAKLE